jgi:hemerythrin-like domain-containing protein
METATKNLENDHVYILRLIDVMEKAIKSTDPNVKNLQQMIDLIKNYADGFHHAKEENLLFPMLALRGFSPEQGPVAVMLHEHTVGRNYVKGMSENLEKYLTGNQSSIRQIYENMAAYIELLRAHIAKENNILFRMADNALSADDQQNLLQQFGEIENTNQSNFIEQIEKLEQAY